MSVDLDFEVFLIDVKVDIVNIKLRNNCSVLGLRIELRSHTQRLDRTSSLNTSRDGEELSLVSEVEIAVDIRVDDVHGESIGSSVKLNLDIIRV